MVTNFRAMEILARELAPNGSVGVVDSSDDLEGGLVEVMVPDRTARGYMVEHARAAGRRDAVRVAHGSVIRALVEEHYLWPIRRTRRGPWSPAS